MHVTGRDVRFTLVAAGALALAAFFMAGQGLATRLALGAIRTYRTHISTRSLLRYGHCRLRPTCSDYAEKVVTRFGALKGGLLVVRRLARCGPWTPDGTQDQPPAAKTLHQDASSRR